MASVLARRRATSIALEVRPTVICEPYTCNLIRYLRILLTDIKVIRYWLSALSKSGHVSYTRTVRDGALAARFARFGMQSHASRPATERY